MIVAIGVAIALASIWGAAYLLSLWHEDRADMIAQGFHPGWPVSRVIAYLAILCTVASNVLAAVTALRLLDVPNFRAIQLALQPLTLPSIVWLDLAFVVLAVYLRVVRARSGRRPL